MSRTDVAAKVTDCIIEALEAGTVPWERPWRRVNGTGPQNVAGRDYRGVNTLILETVSMARGYQSPFWATFNQAKQNRWKLADAKGKGVAVVLWKPVQRKPQDDETPEEAGSYLLLRYFTVFNLDHIEQGDGKPLPVIGVPETEPPPPIEAAEAIVAAMPMRPPIQSGGDRAYYNPMQDSVQMPPAEAFRTADDRYHVLFHELAHATGHEKRLKRKTLLGHAPFGSKTYGQEELVAEIASCLVATEAGIEPDVAQSAAYCQSWLDWAKDNRKALVTAAAQAQKAADYILNRREKAA